MTRDPYIIGDDATLIEAYSRMRDYKIRRLPVVGPDAMLRGIVTKSDIEQVMPFGPHGGDRREALYSLAGMIVAEVMASKLVTVSPSQAISEAAQAMLRARVSGLPVVEAGRVVGIITESDIFRLVVEEWATQT